MREVSARFKSMQTNLVLIGRVATCGMKVLFYPYFIVFRTVAHATLNVAVFPLYDQIENIDI